MEGENGETYPFEFPIGVLLGETLLGRPIIVSLSVPNLLAGVAGLGAEAVGGAVLEHGVEVGVAIAAAAVGVGLAALLALVREGARAPGAGQACGEHGDDDGGSGCLHCDGMGRLWAG